MQSRSDETIAPASSFSPPSQAGYTGYRASRGRGSVGDSPQLPAEIRDYLDGALSRLIAVVSPDRTRVDRSGVRFFRAPGRVNLIGDHTDYNGGLVLPMAIDLAVFLACLPSRNVFLISRREPDLVALAPDGSQAVSNYSLPEWGRYVQGVLVELTERGRPPKGFYGAIASQIPPGRGLSSSAALEVAVATAALALAELSLSPWELAEACRSAEQRYAGVACGIMDQAISIMGKAGHALLIDTARKSAEQIPMPELFDIVAIDSGVRRSLAEAAYNARRQECASALQMLNKDGRIGKIDTLSDITEEHLNEATKPLPAILAKRVRHVVTENVRVRKVSEILRELYSLYRESPDPKSARVLQSRVDSCLAKLRELLEDSHTSLVTQYDAGHPTTNFLVEQAAHEPGYIGARQTGAGWGGSVVIFAKKGTGADLARSLIQQITRNPQTRNIAGPDATAPSFHVCESSQGASEL